LCSLALKSFTVVWAEGDSDTFFSRMYLLIRFSEIKHSAYEAKLYCASSAKSSTQESILPLFFAPTGGEYSSETALNRPLDVLSLGVILSFSGSPVFRLSILHLSQ